MKKLVLFTFIAFVLFSCGNKQQKQTNSEVQETVAEEVVLTIDELYASATDVVDKEVTIKGTVMHVCQHGGQRCFLMGSNEDINIRVEAGEKIGAFSQELMGSDLEITGVFKEVKTEADAHNPGQEHGEAAEGEYTEDAETENAHKIIAEAQEAAEVVYFVQGIKVKEL